MDTRIFAGPDFVVLEPVVEEKSAGGILMVGSGTEKLRRAVVVSCGDKYITKLDNDEEYPVFGQGSVVLYSIYAGEEFKENGKNYIVTRGSEIRAILC